MTSKHYFLASNGSFVECEELYHWGIKGMKWGVRRYQNKDGSLTPEGRKRLGLDAYDKDHNSDIILKKGTKASRVVSTNRYYEFSDPEVGGSPEQAKKYLNDVMAKEKALENKYLSIDNVRNSGRQNGKDFYLSWFTDGGCAPNDAMVTMYELKKDVKVASGKQVMDTLLKEVGSQKVTDLLKNNLNINNLTLEYTKNRELFNKVNKHFIDKGYDAIEDINDPDTDMPIVMFNSVKNLGNVISVQTGKEAIDEYFKRNP